MISEANFAAARTEPDDIELESPKQSFRTTAFKAHRIPIEDTTRFSASEEILSVNKTEQIFSTALVSHKIKSYDSHEIEVRLAQLMKSPEIRAVMAAAQNLAMEQNISEINAVHSIVDSLKELSGIWDQILIKAGVQTLGADLH